MSGSTFKTAGACGSAVISFLWFLSVICPWRWISSVGMLFDFQGSLLAVRSNAGTISGGALMLSKLFLSHKTTDAIAKCINQDQWWEDALHDYCSSGMEFQFGWCSTWTLATYASYAMLILGLSTSTTFAAASCLLYYYAHVKATKTGRMSLKVCFILGPCLATVGLLQYSLLTLDFGQDKISAGAGMPAMCMWGPAYVFSICLLLCSFAPLYVMQVFFRADPLEKERSDSGVELGPLGGPSDVRNMGPGMLPPQSGQFVYSNAYPSQTQYPGSNQMQYPVRPPISSQPQSWGPMWGQPVSGNGQWGNAQVLAPGFGGAAW